MILFGGEGAGKSVTALGICLVEFRKGLDFDFIDAGEFADLWAFQDKGRIAQLKRAGLLVIDEIGDCEDIKGPSFGLMKRVINHRYRNDKPSILATVQGESELKKAVTVEVVDRFPESLWIGTKDGSWRAK
jgi:DNA replication protein DnaC